MYNNKPVYKLYLLEENDYVKIIFDISNLIVDYIKLYQQIYVNLEYEDLNVCFCENEKNILSSLLPQNNTFKKTHSKTIYTEQHIDLKNNLFKKIKKAEEKNIDCKLILKSLIKDVQEIQKCYNKIYENKDYNDSLGVVVKTNIVEMKNKPNKPNNADILNDYERLAKELKTQKSEEQVNDVECFDSNKLHYSYIIEDWIETSTNVSTSKYIILYNNIYEAALICPYNQRIELICEEFKDFEILREYDLDNKCLETMTDLIKKTMYCKKDVLEKKLDGFEAINDINRISQNDKEKSLILFYIQANYNISSDMNKRIKVSTLLDDVQKDLKLNNPNLKYNFAMYLSELGLQKKRYSDGMYLYGIESKVYEKLNSNYSLSDYVKKRRDDSKIFRHDKHDFKLLECENIDGKVYGFDMARDNLGKFFDTTEQKATIKGDNPFLRYF